MLTPGDRATHTLASLERIAAQIFLRKSYGSQICLVGQIQQTVQTKSKFIDEPPTAGTDGLHFENPIALSSRGLLVETYVQRRNFWRVPTGSPNVGTDGRGLPEDMPENYALPGFVIEAFQRIEQGGVVDHLRDLRVATISKLGD
jgi:hypothetical protein